jgi:hypothetical protein
MLNMGNRSFKLVRTLRDRPNLDTDLLKEFWHCDTVLKKDGVFYFCREIEDVEFETLP